MKKTLTISIPTWNRSFYLKELLHELTAQIITYNLQEQIDILVSNNNSDDDTEIVVDVFKSKYSFIRYNKNSSNIGAKSNVIKSMALAESEFVLILGDDDRIRKDCLKDILEILKSKSDIGVVIDTSISKVKSSHQNGVIKLEDMLKLFYWYIGNAGLFIMRTHFIKDLLNKFSYDEFNECWPQTQAMIVGVQTNNKYKCYLHELNIHSGSIHADVMIYNSFYLWRTCSLELVKAIDGIKNLVTLDVYQSARIYIKKSLPQQFFNILQCAVFVDDSDNRKKTYKHISKNLNLFSTYEKAIFFVVIFVLYLPISISQPLSNLAIFLLKGKKGLDKKNNFVKHELAKKEKLKLSKSGAIRTLEFEIE